MAKLEALKDSLADLSARPVGLPDDALSALATRDEISEIGTALEAVRDAVAELATASADEDPAGALQPLKEAVDALAARPDFSTDGLATADSVSALAAELAALREENAALVQRVEALTSAVDAVARRPDPVLDLGPQRELFSPAIQRYWTDLAGRVEAAASRFETEDLAAVRSMLESLPDGSSDDGKIDAAISRMEALTSAVEAVGRRPDPVLDLGPQRELFARYAAVLDKLAKRVETAATRFETEDLAALRTAFEELELPGPSSDNSKIDAVLEAITALTARADDVSVKPDVVAALEPALKRLEASADALRANHGAIRTEGGPATGGDALQALLETNRKLAEAATRGPAAYPDSALIRDLRFALAEVIAGAKQAGGS